jgi:hypothetical protein
MGRTDARRGRLNATQAATIGNASCRLRKCNDAYRPSIHILKCSMLSGTDSIFAEQVGYKQSFSSSFLKDVPQLLLVLVNSEFVALKFFFPNRS